MNQANMIEQLVNNGYAVLQGYCKIPPSAIAEADALLTDETYKVGRSYKTNNPISLPGELYFLACNIEINQVFGAMYPGIGCQDVFITHEYKNEEMERNNWLHFDRLRCLKAMVYLEDVGEPDGPFSVVPGSHKRGHELRSGFLGKAYEEKPNRIELDYPELLVEPTKICGPAGTLILFDTDIFHKGGDVDDGKERKLIRSHWYVDHNWREKS